MKRVKMSQLIVDHVMLVYLHDLLSLREKDEHFYQSDVYRVLTEPALVTVVLGLRKSMMLSFGLLSYIFFLKWAYRSMGWTWQWIGIGLFVLLYWVVFTFIRHEVKEMQYQFQLKRAAKYALEHFDYKEFVIFLDQYLSVKSSKVYFEEKAYHT